METNYWSRDSQVSWNRYPNGVGTNAGTEPLLEYQPAVRIWDYSKLYAEREVRIASQVLTFFEQRQQQFEPGQAVQVETTLGFTESQICVSIYSWFGCHYRWKYGTLARQTFFQAIYSWKSAQIRRQNLQTGGYQWIHLELYNLHQWTRFHGRSWACSNSGDALIEWSWGISLNRGCWQLLHRHSSRESSVRTWYVSYWNTEK